MEITQIDENKYDKLKSEVFNINENEYIIETNLDKIKLNIANKNPENNLRYEINKYKNEIIKLKGKLCNFSQLNTNTDLITNNKKLKEDLIKLSTISNEKNFKLVEENKQLIETNI